MVLSSKAQVLAILLVLFVICDILLTPLGGLETRSISNTTTVGLVTLVFLFIGLALNVASLITLFRKPKLAPTLAIIGSICFFPAIIADQTGLFSTQQRPIAISYLEIFTGLLLIVVIGLASMIRGENSVSKPASI